MKKRVITRHDHELGEYVVFQILNNDDPQSSDHFYMKETEEMKKKIYGNSAYHDIDETSILHFDIVPGVSAMRINMALEMDIENTFGSVQQLP